MRFSHVCDVIVNSNGFTVDFQPLPFTSYSDVVYFNDRFCILTVFCEDTKLQYHRYAVVYDTSLGFDFVDLVTCLFNLDFVDDICSKVGLV